ncbi:EamA family transporter [Pseudonocardia yuanmonensis]|uniref:EamA family transporter n=1 Tax=Pseudonocardia yuanmonensis TaxID=1095914 RepID=A0ABP8W9C1_9PSEU
MTDLAARPTTHTTRPARRTAIGLVVGGEFSMQFGAALAALLFARLGATGTVGLRLGISALVLLLVCRPRLRGRTRGDLLTVLGYGLALGGMNICFYEAIARIPLGAAVTLEVLGPLALSVLTGRGLLSALWAALALAGVALLGEDGFTGGLDLVGVGFALLAGVLWACYIVLAQRAGGSFAKLDGLALALGVSAVVALPLGVAGAGAALLDPVALGLGAAVAVLSSLLPYSLELLALRSVPASTFAVVMSLSPAVAALAGALVLGQTLSPLGAVAIGLVVAAGAGAVRWGGRRGAAVSAQA